MNPAAYDWGDIWAVHKLRDMIIQSAQENRTVLDTEFPIELWNNCSYYGLFCEDNFDESGIIKATSLFSKESFDARKEIEDYYGETQLLVCFYQHNVSNPIPSQYDIVAPVVINYLKGKYPDFPKMPPPPQCYPRYPPTQGCQTVKLVLLLILTSWVFLRKVTYLKVIWTHGRKIFIQTYNILRLWMMKIRMM